MADGWGISRDQLIMKCRVLKGTDCKAHSLDSVARCIPQIRRMVSRTWFSTTLGFGPLDVAPILTRSPLHLKKHIDHMG